MSLTSTTDSSQTTIKMITRILKHGILLGIIISFVVSLEISLTPLRVIHLALAIIALEYYAYNIHKSLFAFFEKRRKLKIF